MSITLTLNLHSILKAEHILLELAESFSQRFILKKILLMMLTFQDQVLIPLFQLNETQENSQFDLKLLYIHLFKITQKDILVQVSMI